MKKSERAILYDIILFAVISLLIYRGYILIEKRHEEPRIMFEDWLNENEKTIDINGDNTVIVH